MKGLYVDYPKLREIAWGKGSDIRTALNLTKVSVSRKISGKQRLALDELNAIAKAIGVDITEFVHLREMESDGNTGNGAKVSNYGQVSAFTSPTKTEVKMNLDLQAEDIFIHAPCGREVVIGILNGKQVTLEVIEAYITENDDPATERKVQTLVKHRCKAGEA